MKGTIKNVVVGKGFGFIRGENLTDYFFHVNDMQPGVPFDETLTEMFVSFDVSRNDSRGPRAANVRKAD